MLMGLEHMDIQRDPVPEDTLGQNGIRQVLKSDRIEFMFRKHDASVPATIDNTR